MGDAARRRGATERGKACKRCSTSGKGTCTARANGIPAAPSAQQYPGVVVEGDGERAARRHRSARQDDGLPWIDLQPPSSRPGHEQACRVRGRTGRRRWGTCPRAPAAGACSTLSLKCLRAYSQARPPSMIARTRARRGAGTVAPSEPAGVGARASRRPSGRARLPLGHLRCVLLVAPTKRKLKFVCHEHESRPAMLSESTAQRIQGATTGSQQRGPRRGPRGAAYAGCSSAALRRRLSRTGRQAKAIARRRHYRGCAEVGERAGAVAERATRAGMRDPLLQGRRACISTPTGVLPPWVRARARAPLLCALHAELSTRENGNACRRQRGPHGRVGTARTGAGEHGGVYR